MSRRSFPILLAAAAGVSLGGCDLLGLSGNASSDAVENSQAPAAPANARLQRACASDATYDRLKELVFDEAARVRNGESVMLDRLATASIVRMERPLVRSRDEDLNITLCSGHFILELPPGAENAFDGQRRLTADIQYSAQAAADGSGLVYDMEGAEPIIYRLASVGGVAPRSAARPAPQAQPQAQAQPQPQPAPAPAPRPVQTAEAPRPRPAPAPVPAPAPAPAPRPDPRPAEPAPKQEAPTPPRATAARPSFNCARARSRSEQMVCSSPSLAALDRQMSSQFYSALANADPAAHARLRRSRDRFLAFRERCGSEACVAQAYRDRMDEIRDIGGR